MKDYAIGNKLKNYFAVPSNGNEKLSKLVSITSKDKRLLTLLKSSNINAIDRKIVATHILKMLRILTKKRIILSIVKNYNMEIDDAEIVATLASLLHDVGHVVHIKNHHFSILIAFKY
jgi:metal-dependent HD superfamily phosphatase/phosphodiesterase